MALEKDLSSSSQVHAN